MRTLVDTGWSSEWKQPRSQGLRSKHKGIIEINWLCLRIGCKTNSGRSSLCPFKWRLFKLVYLNYLSKRSSSDSKRETNMETTNRPFCCCNPCFLVLEGVLDRPPQTFFRGVVVQLGWRAHFWCFWCLIPNLRHPAGQQLLVYITINSHEWAKRFKYYHVLAILKVSSSIPCYSHEKPLVVTSMATPCAFAVKTSSKSTSKTKTSFLTELSPARSGIVPFSCSKKQHPNR